jgi:RNA polymerase sigma factor (sigma-70 family)
MSLINKYKKFIHDYEEEDLYQEVLTHLDLKLNNYDQSKSAIGTFVYMVVKNKLYNMVNNKHNVKHSVAEEGVIEGIMESQREDLPLADKIALEVAYEVIRDHENKDMLSDLIKGLNQNQCAEKYKMTQQNVSRIWKKFIEDVKDGL